MKEKEFLAAVLEPEGCVAGDDDNAPKTGAADASTSSSSGGASSSGSTGTSDAAPDTNDAAAADACPPDAELPTPPCYLIK